MDLEEALNQLDHRLEAVESATESNRITSASVYKQFSDDFDLLSQKLCNAKHESKDLNKACNINFDQLKQCDFSSLDEELDENRLMEKLVKLNMLLPNEALLDKSFDNLQQTEQDLTQMESFHLEELEKQIQNCWQNAHKLEQLNSYVSKSIDGIVKLYAKSASCWLAQLADIEKRIDNVRNEESEC